MELLIPFALKSFLLAGAALLLLRLFRRHSAAARSVIAHLALLALLLVPAASLVIPRLPISVPGLAADGGTSSPAWVAFFNAATSLPTAAAMPETAGNPGDWVVLGYAAPAIGLLFIVLLALGRLFALRARTHVLVEPIWLNALTHAQDRMGFRHRAALLVSDELPSPISWGLVRPVILLNQAALRVPQHAEAIIAHELAHIVRFDWGKLLFARVLTALYWFNPFVWMLAREAHQLREETADDAVLAANIAGTDYAQLLVGAARQRRKGLLLAAHGVAPSRKSLARRIRRVLDATSVRGPVARGFAAGVAASMFAVAMTLAALSFDAEPTPSAEGQRPSVGILGSDAKQATTVTKPGNASLLVKVEPDGSCGVYVGQTRFTSKELDRAVKRLKADFETASGTQDIKPTKSPVVFLRGDFHTPWRCIAGTVYAMQLAGFPKIGFISLSPPTDGVKSYPPPVTDRPRPLADPIRNKIVVASNGATMWNGRPIRNKVAVASSGAIMWNGTPISPVLLRQYLDQTVQMVPEPELQLQPDSEARYEQVDQVLAIIKHAGVRKMGFVGNDQYYRKF